MKDKPSEWIAISDLMAGVMAVVMLMLVIAVLQKNISEIAYQEELTKGKVGKINPIDQVIKTLDSIVKSKSATEFITLDLHTGRLTLSDGGFERGSACLQAGAKIAMESVQSDLANFVRENPKARILIEGHTDNVPVSRPVIDYKHFCTVYDDNFTLSAARAREARRYLIGNIDSDFAKRIVVAGYGESKPLQGLDPANPKNRRVEVLFLNE